MFKFKTILSLALPALLMAVPAAAMADVKIGFLNLQRVSNEAPQAQRAMKKIKAEFDKRDLELQKMTKQLQAMQEKLEKEGVTLSEGDRRNREREFNDLNRDLQRKQREFREDLSVRQNEELAALYESVDRVIKKIAETEKYDLIVQEAVYHGPAIDITNKVLKALGDSGGGAPAAGGPASAPAAAK